MDSARFDYPLPQELIAQEPASRRDAARLMVVDRDRQSVTHARFSDLPDFLPPTSRYFRNNAAVLKARLFGKRPTGGQVECLLLEPAEDAKTWWCLLRPGKKALQAGWFGREDAFRADVLEAGDNGNYRVRFTTTHSESVADLAERLGTVPLPPYIERSADDPRGETDNERYQTVYADPSRKVAVAAPTAGLHFTPELISAMQANGATFFDLTLQIGIGTFHPIQTERIEAHTIHTEWYSLPAPALRALQHHDPSRPRVAIGTTSVRTMEDALRRVAREPERCLTPTGSVEAEADLFIYPPAEFLGVDALVTNFHLPKSTLLCLVASFLTPGSEAGIDWLKALYAEAVARGYRFYSYGDAMLIR